jgi:hypothetical protein
MQHSGSTAATDQQQSSNRAATEQTVAAQQQCQSKASVSLLRQPAECTHEYFIGMNFGTSDFNADVYSSLINLKFGAAVLTTASCIHV